MDPQSMPPSRRFAVSLSVMYKESAKNLSASGTVEISPERFVFEGRASANHFFKQIRQEVACADVFHMARAGNDIALLVKIQAEPPAAATYELRFASGTEADEAVALLPRVSNPAVTLQMQQTNDFGRSLFEATPRVFVTRSIIVINVLVFLSMVVALRTIDPTIPQLIDWQANFGLKTLSGEWWRLGTCVFIHLGLLHIALNMWALGGVGDLVERLYGNGAYALLYLTSGLAGSVASTYWSPNVVSGGASGAIFGVYGALLAYIRVNPTAIPQHILVELQSSTTGFVVYNLLFGFSQSGIDNAAHIGGLVMGFLMGRLLALPLRMTDLTRARFGRACGALVVAGALLGGALRVIPRTAGDLQRLVDRVVEREAQANAALNTLVEQAKAGKLTDGPMAEGIEKQCLTAWARSVEELSGFPIDRLPTSKPFHGRMLRYCELRRDAVMHLAKGLREGKPAEIKRYHELSQKANEVAGNKGGS